MGPIGRFFLMSPSGSKLGKGYAEFGGKPIRRKNIFTEKPSKSP
jgi:hypothetical protein